MKPAELAMTYAILMEPSCAPVIAQAAKSTGAPVPLLRTAVLSGQLTQPQLKWCFQNHHGVVAGDAVSVSTDVDWLTHLYRTQPRQAESGLAWNPATPPGILAELAHKSLARTQRILLRNPATPPDVASALATPAILRGVPSSVSAQPAGFAAAALTSHRHLAAGLATYGPSAMRRIAARVPDLTAAEVDAIVNAPDPADRVRESARMGPARRMYAMNPFSHELDDRSWYVNAEVDRVVALRALADPGILRTGVSLREAAAVGNPHVDAAIPQAYAQRAHQDDDTEGMVTFLSRSDLECDVLAAMLLALPAAWAARLVRGVSGAKLKGVMQTSRRIAYVQPLWQLGAIPRSELPTRTQQMLGHPSALAAAGLLPGILGSDASAWMAFAATPAAFAGDLEAAAHAVADALAPNVKLPAQPSRARSRSPQVAGG